MRGSVYGYESHTCEKSTMMATSEKQLASRKSQRYIRQGGQYVANPQNMLLQNNKDSPSEMLTGSSYTALVQRSPYRPPRHPSASSMQCARQRGDEGNMRTHEQIRHPSYVCGSTVSTLPPRGSEIFRRSHHAKSRNPPSYQQGSELDQSTGSSRNINRCATYPAPNMDRQKRKLQSIAEEEQFSTEQGTERGAIHLTPSVDTAVHTKRQRVFYQENVIIRDMSQSHRHREGEIYQSTIHSGQSQGYDRPSMSWPTISQEKTGHHQAGHCHSTPPHSMASRMVSWERGQPPPQHEPHTNAGVRAEFEPPRSPNLRKHNVHGRVLQARADLHLTMPHFVEVPESNHTSRKTSTVHEPWVTNFIPRNHCHRGARPSYLEEREQTFSYDTHDGITNAMDKPHHLAEHEGFERYVGFQNDDHVKLITFDQNMNVQDRGNVHHYASQTDHDARSTHTRHEWGTASNDLEHDQKLYACHDIETRDGPELGTVDYSCRSAILSHREEKYRSEAREAEIQLRNQSYTDTRDDVNSHSREDGTVGRYHGPPMSSLTASRETSINQTEERDNVCCGDEMKPCVISEDQMRTRNGILLLAQPQDRISLSETLSMIRENIEVFTATPADVDAPAPGRKRPVVVDQVGLRCIHCRDAIHQGERVKRAVCFPSSIKRIYRTVIDMKLDHFQSCKFVPLTLKNRLNELKAINTRSTGTTMHYFVQAATRMGMVDSPQGVKFANEQTSAHQMQNKQEERITHELRTQCAPQPDPESLSSKDDSEGTGESVDNTSATTSKDDFRRCRSESSGSNDVDPVTPSVSMEVTTEDKDEDTNSAEGTVTAGGAGGDVLTRSGSSNDVTQTFYSGRALLALEDDKTSLSPLRCFLRENVYAFSATSEDIAVRTPTTFSVVLGQVGIGCIHCLSLPAKERSNRAVCFPFSVSRIYQSVADIQRFHLGECKMVPEHVKEKFISLQNASSKGSKGLATRQYWVASAKKLGLVDTSSGIRFSRDPTKPITPADSLDILAQVASNVTTANRPLVLPEDKEKIAGFLYTVMEQLQPCRFTEADKNKRRLKDVGCIGVECKHCAGQVDGRKFFWSSVNAVESNFVSVHTHMMECRMIPKAIKNQLAELKKLRKEQTSSLKTGSQKAFFARVWKRLHDDGGAMLKSSETSQKVRPSIRKVQSKTEGMSVVAV